MKILKTGLCEIFFVALYGTFAASQTAGGPLSLEISAIQSVVPSGSPVKVKTEVTNTSSAVIRCSEGGIEFEIEVRDSTGTLMQTTEKYRESRRKPALRQVTIAVAPGETKKWLFVLSDMYDLSKPGQYSVQIRWPGGGEYAPALSNIISVTITTAASGNLEVPKASLALEIDATQDVLKVGSPVNIAISAINLTNHDLDLDNALTLYSIEIADGGKIEPPLTEGGKRHQQFHGYSGGHHVHLTPGETTGMGILPIGELYDLSRPGEYTIQIARVDEETKTLVKSNTVNITVKP